METIYKMSNVGAAETKWNIKSYREGGFFNRKKSTLGVEASYKRAGYCLGYSIIWGRLMVSGRLAEARTPPKELDAGLIQQRFLMNTVRIKSGPLYPLYPERGRGFATRLVVKNILDELDCNPRMRRIPWQGIPLTVKSFGGVYLIGLGLHMCGTAKIDDTYYIFDSNSGFYSFNDFSEFNVISCTLYDYYDRENFIFKDKFVQCFKLTSADRFL